MRRYISAAFVTGAALGGAGGATASYVAAQPREPVSIQYTHEAEETKLLNELADRVDAGDVIIAIRLKDSAVAWQVEAK